MTEPGDSAPIARLLESREAFLSFLERRLGDRETASDVLHSAYLRALDRSGQLRDGERAVAWFYRLLRNAVTDHWRRRGAESRALTALATELAGAAAAPPALRAEICRCFEPLLQTLNEDQARALRSVEMAGQRPVDYAAAEGISANNAMVRLHRARRALRERLLQTCRACAEHGCLDCTCRENGGPP